MCASSHNAALCLSPLHSPVLAALPSSVSGAPYSSGNCHRSDCCSLDAMEAVIGHRRRAEINAAVITVDFRQRGGPWRQNPPRSTPPAEGQRGTGEGRGGGGAPRACYSCTEARLGVHQTVHAPASICFPPPCGVLPFGPHPAREPLTRTKSFSASI